MFSRVVSVLASATCIVGLSSAAIAGSSSADSKFFNELTGQWKGPGEIVAGKYKGTKFVCDFSGTTPNGQTGMTLDGGCRVGVFNQKMKATVLRTGSKYSGAFLDGAKGEGLDVTAGSVSGDRVVLSLQRNELNGAMLARLANPNQMNVTVSVRVNDDLVPVIGMKLNRVDGTKIGSIK